MNRLLIGKSGDEVVSIFIKGIFIGSTLSVPGMSGGTMAMLLGVYEPLIRSINKLIKRGERKRGAIAFLLAFAGGAMVGFFSISSVILRLIQIAPMPMTFFFCGIIVGGVPKIFAEIKGGRFCWSDLLYILMGAICVLFISYLPKDLFQIGVTFDFWSVIKQMIGGIIIAVALVLPGISVSQMLYVLGIYKGVVTAVSSFNIAGILPMICGISFGILLFSHWMDHCFLRYRKVVYSVVFGFMIGSVFELFSGGIKDEFTAVCIPLFIIGYCLMRLISKKQVDA